MRKWMAILTAFALIGFGASGASAATIDLFEWAFNVDGTTTYMPVLPGSIDPSTGLGSVTVTITGAASHFFIGYFDHEIDQTDNTYFNEFGSAIGTPAAGQSWEIDEPGYAGIMGDIYANVTAGLLDNLNAVGNPPIDDVSMALGWNFALLAGETATITLTLGTTAPVSGFYLQQTDPESGADIYYYGTINIQGGGTAVPEPATLMLLVSGLAGLFGVRRKFSK
jgi:hypothetical protein